MEKGGRAPVVFKIRSVFRLRHYSMEPRLASVFAVRPRLTINPDGVFEVHIPRGVARVKTTHDKHEVETDVTEFDVARQAAGASQEDANVTYSIRSASAQERTAFLKRETAPQVPSIAADSYSGDVENVDIVPQADIVSFESQKYRKPK